MSKKVTSLLVERGRKQIHTDKAGTSIVGKDGIALYRLLMIKSGLEFEIRTNGMKLTRGPSCFTIIRREFDVRGRDKVKAYVTFCEKFGLETRPDVVGV